MKPEKLLATTCSVLLIAALLADLRWPGDCTDGDFCPAHCNIACAQVH